MNKIIKMVGMLVVFFLISYFLSGIIEGESVLEDKIVFIPVKGVISTSADLFNQDIADPETIAGYLDQADNDDSIKAIILEIDSPGGTVVASEEIARAVKQTKKPVVAWIRETGASGAYWVASSADKIVADPLSMTGSIGVYSGYLEFSGLFEKYGIDYVDLKSGEYKDTGSPFKELSSDERLILENKLKIVHSIFIDEVAKNRNMTIDEVKKLSSGIYYLGLEAYKFGLVDYLGDKNKAIEVAKELSNTKEVRLVRFERKTGLLGIFNQLSTGAFFNIGRGIAYELDFNVKENYLDFRV
ncbi:MAG: signal peptide peptidase SppA [Candidatus Nanoarchaeia archaeon]|nr:signal peptide peptidase SppA [Candidatus Nanoarchaeia archaeon]